MISQIVVAQIDRSLRPGLLLPTQQLELTWAVNDAADVASKSLTVDGRVVSGYWGPVGTQTASTHYWAGILGLVGAGDHHYTIRVTDTNGKWATYSGTFNVAGSAISNIVVAEADAGTESWSRTNNS